MARGQVAGRGAVAAAGGPTRVSTRPPAHTPHAGSRPRNAGTQRLHTTAVLEVWARLGRGRPTLSHGPQAHNGCFGGVGAYLEQLVATLDEAAEEAERELLVGDRRLDFLRAEGQPVVRARHQLRHAHDPAAQQEAADVVVPRVRDAFEAVRAVEVRLLLRQHPDKVADLEALRAGRRQRRRLCGEDGLRPAHAQRRTAQRPRHPASASGQPPPLIRGAPPPLGSHAMDPAASGCGPGAAAASCCGPGRRTAARESRRRTALTSSSSCWSRGSVL
eukprot:3973837-Prymnesium_polylepis.3